MSTKPQEIPRDEISKLINSLRDVYSKEELERIEETLEKLESRGKKKAKQIRPIVPIREWLESEYYLGPFTYDLYPYWKEQIIKIFESPVKINEVILTGSTGCLKTDTLYSTTEGFKTISELVNANFNIRSEGTIEKAIADKNNIIGIEDTKIITLENGTVLEGTLNHRIKVLRDHKINWVRFDQLIVGDIIIHSRTKEPFGNKELPLDLAYLIGYILGDGYVADEKNSVYLSLAFRKAQSNYKSIVKSFNKYFGKGNILQDKRRKDLWTISKTSADFHNLPYINSIKQNAHNKYLNSFLLAHNDKTTSMILRGLFDADSGVSEKSANIELTLVSQQLITQVKRILAAYGINSKLTTKYSKLDGKEFKAYRLTIRGQRDLELFNKYIGFSIDYKQKILDAILNKSHRNQRTLIPGLLQLLRYHDKEISLNRTRRNYYITGNLYSQSKALNTSERVFEKLKQTEIDWLYKNETLKYFIDHDVYTVRVKNIEDSKSEVGDITVPTTHFYNIGGIISHNSGKTSAATVIIIRKLYELSCYENISSLFPNLSSISRIAFAYLSVTATQAKTTGFSNIREMFDSIPYFREQFPRKADIDSMLIWEKERLFVTYGSVLNHFIGLDLLGAVLDEANYFAGREIVDTGVADTSNPIYLLYDQVVSRAHSRFVTKDGNDSLSVIASSATISSSFTEGRIKKGLDDPTVFIASPAIWDVRPEQYGLERFFVFAGSELVDPMIINNLDDLNEILEPHKYNLILDNISLEQALELVPTDIRYKIIKVPEEHRSAFKSNIIYMLQDLAGYSVASSNKFFTSKTAYESCKNEALVHPFSKESVILSTTKEISQDGYLELIDYFLPNYTFSDPTTPRFMHLDLALTNDSVGMAMVHIDGWKKLNEQYEEAKEEIPKSFFVGGTSSAFEAQLKVFNPISGIQIHQNELKLPTVKVDFMLEIKPPNKPNRISFSKIRDFIIWLKYVKKVNIQLVTMDQFQSAQMQQELSDTGISTAYLSVDRTPTPYRTLAALIQDRRISYYEYKKFNQELFSLIETRTQGNKVKIDHPRGGSKDISDAVAGAVFSAISAEDKSNLTDSGLVDIFINTNEGISEETNIQSTIDNLTNMLKL